MANPSRLGVKVRSLRRKQGLTQKQLAQRLEISPSYLNLIEHGKRPLPAPLLIKLAGMFGIDLQVFAEDDDARLLADIMEALGDPIFDEQRITQQDAREFIQTSPGVARAMLSLYRGFLQSRQSSENLAARIQDVGGPGLSQLASPEEEVSDLIQRHLNYFPSLEDRAERLWRDAGLEQQDLYAGLVRHLDRALGIKVKFAPIGGRRVMRSFDPERRELVLGELLPPRSRTFQVAVQLGLLTAEDVLDSLSSDERLGSPESRGLARLALANYFAGAVIMPYEPFLQTARAHRYDVALIGHRFRTSFEQVCHRCTSLRRPGSEGIPFHMVRVDIAGNLSKRFSASGIRFARYSGACPKWNVHASFLTPGMIRPQVSAMPDGSVYFCFARTVRKDLGGYHSPRSVHAIGLGCDISHAREIVYSDGVDVDNLEAAVPVGVTCRLCERVDCQERAFAPIHHPLRINVNQQGFNFYAPIDD